MAKKKNKRARRAAGSSNPSWISNLAFDPARNPDARALVGYPRQPADSGPLQLYLDLNLNDYIEIDPADILDKKALGDGAGVAQSVVWVKGSALIKEVRAFKLDVQAQFMRGRLAEQFLKRISARTIADYLSSPQRPTTIDTTLTCMSACFACGSYDPCG